MKKIFSAILFSVILAGMFSGCQQAKVPDDLSTLLENNLGKPQQEIVKALNIDGDEWEKEQTDQKTVYQKKENVTLAGLPAELQLVFVDDVLSQISLSAYCEDISEQEMGSAIRQLYDDCVDAFGEPKKPNSDYSQYEFDWSVYGDGQELIENIPYNQDYACSMLWSFWKDFSEDFPNIMVHTVARCKPSGEWTGEAFLGLLIEKDISDDAELTKIADDLLA